MVYFICRVQNNCIIYYVHFLFLLDIFDYSDSDGWDVDEEDEMFSV